MSEKKDGMTFAMLLAVVAALMPEKGPDSKDSDEWRMLFGNEKTEENDADGN